MRLAHRHGIAPRVEPAARVHDHVARAPGIRIHQEAVELAEVVAIPIDDIEVLEIEHARIEIPGFHEAQASAR